jgi:hypothetical protein
MEAICFKCGNEKKDFNDQCGHCGANPRNDQEDTARSMYLSKARFLDPNEWRQYEPDLVQYAHQLKMGKGVVYNEEALEECRRIVEALSKPPQLVDWLKVFIVIAPFFVIPLLVLIWWLLKK